MNPVSTLKIFLEGHTQGQPGTKRASDSKSPKAREKILMTFFSLI